MTTAASSSNSSLSSVIDAILIAVDPEENSYECFGLELKLYEPSVIRRAFYRLALQVHPDKNAAHPRSKEAFQKLSAAFETLYDLTSQKEHLEQIRQEKQSATKTNNEEGRAKNSSSHENKKRKAQSDWKGKRKRKKEQQKSDNQQWTERRWEDVTKELQRREDLEKAFRQRHSNARFEKRVQGMIWRAMRICRTLDEQAGCPPAFVNGLWAPLYEQEVMREHNKRLPEGWEWRWDSNSMVETWSGEQRPTRRVYRNVTTGGEAFQHPVPEVEALLTKARNALETNKFRFHTEPRLFLGEIVEYLKDDHDYVDMDDDMKELEEEEQARLAAMGSSGSGSNNNQKEYDY